ncbi:MAG: PD-(D/E)XK nuclease-like domain-containing protein [Bosea sp. (in: a-proteobacteria)]
MTRAKTSAGHFQGPGVYLDMPDQVYFGIDALGSSDFKRLSEDPMDFYAGSRFNPLSYELPARADSRDYLTLGKVVHKLGFEGQKAFEVEYSVAPPFDAPHSSDVQSMRKALANLDIETAITIAPSAAVKLCRENGLHMKQDLAQIHKHEVEVLGKTPVDYTQYQKAKRIKAALEADPNLSALATGGLSEVSVFWEQEGVMVRARFDKLLPRFCVDAKTITPNFRARSFSQACLWHVRDYRYDIQSALYSEARRVAASLPVYGGTKADRAYLKKMLAVPEDATGQEGWTWAWLFIQPPHDERGKGRALKVLPIFPASNPAWETIMDVASSDISLAITAFKTNLARFGSAKAWQEISQPWIPDQSDWASIFKDRFS